MSDLLGFKQIADAASIDQKGAVSAIVATLDVVDNDGDVIPVDAIPTGTKAMISAYNHDSIVGVMFGTGVPDAPPVGKGAIHIEGNKAVFRGQYFLDTQRGREAFATVKALGADQPWSFAYSKVRVDRPSADWAAKGAMRILAKLGPLPGRDSMEVSPVAAAGGVGTGTLEAHSSRGARAIHEVSAAEVDELVDRARAEAR